jgi:hypothetical protein
VVTPETSDFATRMAFALEKDPADDVRRTTVNLKVVAVTLAWLVIVPILIVYGLTGRHRDGGVLTFAALAIIVGPFVAAVIGVYNRRSGIGGCYVVLTLLMVIPAVWILRAG